MIDVEDMIWYDSFIPISASGIRHPASGSYSTSSSPLKETITVASHDQGISSKFLNRITYHILWISPPYHSLNMHMCLHHHINLITTCNTNSNFKLNTSTCTFTGTKINKYIHWCGNFCRQLRLFASLNWPCQCRIFPWLQLHRWKTYILWNQVHHLRISSLTNTIVTHHISAVMVQSQNKI